MKRTMLNKTEDLSEFEKFANLRLMYLFQFGMPHKKLLFMGQEFGQMNEWNEEAQLPWESLWDHRHKTMQWFVKRLNEVYKYLPAMHEGDNIENGFEWIECLDYRQNILAFIRYNKDYSEMMVYLLNLSKNHFSDFRLGVPYRGTYHKVLDTDAQEFGGNGHNWIDEYRTEDIPAYCHQHSINVNLLPLNGLLFKSVEIERGS
jgi:1,4-alpha-glucan branching enzyme